MSVSLMSAGGGGGKEGALVASWYIGDTDASVIVYDTSSLFNHRFYYNNPIEVSGVRISYDSSSYSWVLTALKPVMWLDKTPKSAGTELARWRYNIRTYVYWTVQ